MSQHAQIDPFAAIKGEMADRVRVFDWTTTPLGPIAGWPQSLKTAVGMVLLSPVPIVMLWGEDGIMIYNDGYSVFAGARHPSLLGSKVREGWPEVADFNDNIMKVGLAGGTLAYRDFVLELNRTGTFEPVWLDLDYSPILDESGKPAGVMAIVIEITDRKRADEALRRSEERLRLATENAGVGLWDIDSEGGIDFSYSRRSSSFVMDRTTRVPMTHLLSRLHPDDAPKLEAAYNAARDPEQRAMMDVEYRVLPEADMPLRWVKIRGRGVFDEDGNLLRIAGTALDITRERETQEALRSSEEQLRLATENAEIGLWDMDVVNNINYAPPRVKAMFGIRANENPPSEAYFKLIHPEDVARVEAVYADAFDPAKRANYDVEYRVIGQDGVLRWIHAKGRGLFDESGTCVRVLGTAIDITAHKQEQARESVLVELGDRLRELEDPDDLAFAAAEVLGRALNVSRVGYGTIDPRNETIFIARDWNAPGVKSLAGTLHFRDYGSYIEDLKRGETVVYSDSRLDPRTAATVDALDGIDARALVNMPVTEQGGFVALLYLNNATVREWSEADLELIREVAERTRIAVERRTAEAALRSSEQQLRLATEHAEIGMWDVDNITGTLVWTREVRKAFGITHDGPVTLEHDFYDGLHPEDREHTAAAYAAANDPDQRALYDVEYRTIGQEDGLVRWVHAKGRGIFDESGKCLRVTGTAMDITARKKIEELARESEAQFRSFAQAMPNQVWASDPKGQLDWFNERALQYGGVSFEGMKGDKWVSILHPNDVAEAAAAWAQALATGENYETQFRLRRADGNYRWHIARAVPIRNEAGEVTRWVGTNTDIDDQKAAAEALHQINETLEHRVIERTAALERSQAALQQAQKMEAIGNLTGGIAHDFNNLLQGLTGSLDLIRRAPEKTERVRHWAEAGLQAAERGAKLTAQLLAFSRSQKMELKPLDLTALLEGMRDLLGRTLGPPVRVILDLTANAASVLGDETQLEMAVLNLAINARDAMGGGGELSIQTRPHHFTDDAELAAGDYIELSVTDSGEGMPVDVIARAFDPFFTTKGVGKGTGLGLSQVYGMARQAGGIARIRSAAGEGTTVSIFLRATSEGATQDTRAATKDDLNAAAPATILVVDDDPGVRQFLTDSLDSFGYAVLEAANGEAGLQILARAAPDLMLVDYAMPGMTGAEVARRARETHPHMPIIFASGYAETAALENGLNENTLILRKPFRLGELQDAIAKALRR